jgi:Ca2+-binding EF-hand superfamily protein
LLATSFIYDSSSSNDQQGRLEMLFDVFDVNDDQKVDKKETLKLIQAVYSIHGKKDAAKDKVAQIFGSYDPDGSLSLSKQEFVRFLVNDNFLSQCQF